MSFNMNNTNKFIPVTFSEESSNYDRGSGEEIGLNSYLTDPGKVLISLFIQSATYKKINEIELTKQAHEQLMDNLSAAISKKNKVVINYLIDQIKESEDCRLRFSSSIKTDYKFLLHDAIDQGMFELAALLLNIALETPKDDRNMNIVYGYSESIESQDKEVKVNSNRRSQEATSKVSKSIKPTNGFSVNANTQITNNVKKIEKKNKSKDKIRL